MNIYIPIEVKARELDGRSLLAVAAAERGHTVILGEKKDTIGLAKRGKLPPGIIHMKSITPHESMLEILTKFNDHGHKVTVQDEESGLADHTYETFARLRYGPETLAYASKVFAWGDFDGISLKEIYPDYADTFVITGSPRVDFWRKDFAAYFEDPPNSHTMEEKPYILVVSNFSSFLNVNRFWNILARLRQAGYFERDENRERYEYENSAYQTLLIGKFVEMIRELTVTFPDYNIVVRPHPVESIEGWEKIIGDFPNVIIKREGTISKWIRHSRMIIHNGCTSAQEAAFSGVHRIAYRPIPNELERAIPNLMSINAFSLEELKNIVSDLLRNKRTANMDEVHDNAEKYLNNRFKNREGRLAADRIIDEWEEIGKEAELQSSDIRDLRQSLQTKKIPLNRRIKRKAAKIRDSILGNSNDSNGSSGLLINAHKFPDFKEEEFGALLTKLRSMLGRFDNVHYERYGSKSFIVTGNKNA